MLIFYPLGYRRPTYVAFVSDGGNSNTFSVNPSSSLGRKLILQVSTDNPAVRHAIIALESLYNKPDIQRRIF